MAGRTLANGYGSEHKRERARWAAIIATRPVPCARGCGRLIRHGERWDLGHSDDRRRWTGPECVQCNRSAGGRASIESRFGGRRSVSRSWR